MPDIGSAGARELGIGSRGAWGLGSVDVFLDYRYRYSVLVSSTGTGSGIYEYGGLGWPDSGKNKNTFKLIQSPTHE
jgi:hypothetical protein